MRRLDLNPSVYKDPPKEASGSRCKVAGGSGRAGYLQLRQALQAGNHRDLGGALCANDFQLLWYGGSAPTPLHCGHANPLACTVTTHLHVL